MNLKKLFAGKKQKEPIIYSAITPLIHHLKFSSQHLMNFSLLRPEEYTESTHFKGQIFSLEDFIQWSVETNGNFDYIDTVQGMNLPMESLIPFYEGKFNPLSIFESNTLKILKGKEGYLIGTFNNSVVKHEIAHGLFHTVPDYRQKVLEVVKNLSPRQNRILEKVLTDDDDGATYDCSFWDTEKNSYIIGGKLHGPVRWKLLGLYREALKSERRKMPCALY